MTTELFNSFRLNFSIPSIRTVMAAGRQGKIGFWKYNKKKLIVLFPSTRTDLNK